MQIIGPIETVKIDTVEASTHTLVEKRERETRTILNVLAMNGWIQWVGKGGIYSPTNKMADSQLHFNIN